MSLKSRQSVGKTIWPSLVFAVITLSTSIPATGDTYEYETPARVVAIGDINGALTEIVALLQQLEIVNQDLSWTGGDSHLVSLGNLSGAGDRTGRVIEMLMKLEQQAPRSGGRVHLVLGDQELSLLEKGAGDSISAEARSWLKQQPVVIKINDKIYAHGGISSSFVGKTLTWLNEHAQKEIDAPSKPGEPSVLSDEGLLRYRGTAMCHPFAESFNTERFLKQVGAKQFVTGHVPTDGNVESRMDGMVILLDTGLAEGGRASAFLATPEGAYVQYLGSTQSSSIEPERRQLSLQISGMDDAEVEALLAHGRIIDIRDIGTGITKPLRVTQLANGVEHLAVFKHVDSDPGAPTAKIYRSRRDSDSDRNVYEIAAYKLDRMLDLQLVPVAIAATVDGKKGVLQDWINDSINERDRMAEDLAFISPCDKNEQYRLRFVFDILIHNEDRNLTNIVWMKENFMLSFIDHTRAFRLDRKRPKQYRKVTLRVCDLLEEKLKSLDLNNLTAELGSLLHSKQIEAIIARRDLILSEMESTNSWH